ncbi:hypothetical protein P7L78_02505 (plasmid) [Tistrella bauzanensis]|uniref:hypothetical protein n=1 Tax=Tistrella TaxID=171436 RepID=UPI0031F66125
MNETHPLVYQPGTPLAATDRRVWHMPVLDSLAAEDTALGSVGADDGDSFS